MSEPQANTERIFWGAQALASAEERARDTFSFPLFKS
jgi:hypothetical protein